MLNIKPNNKFSIVTVEKWEDYQIKKEEMNSKLNNKRTTSEHKQECKECSDYALLTQEEQDDLFYDLMSVDMDKKFR